MKKSVKKTAAKKPLKKSAKKAVKKTAKKKTVKKTTKPQRKSLPRKKAVPTVRAKAKKAPIKAVAAKAVPTQKKLDLSSFVTPLDDRLMVQTSAQERRTAGGLYIPNTVADVSGNLQGVVVAVGRGHMDKKGRMHPMDVKVGDSVVFAQYSGSKIKVQNEELIILRESEVMGVVSK